jgi:peroxiredoxin
MTRFSKWLVAAALLSLLTVGCDFKKSGPSGPRATGAGTRVGNVAADFTLLDQDGRSVTLSSYRGNVILLDLSTMWCTYCQIEASQAEALYQQYRNRGFVLVNALFADYLGNPITVEDCRSWADFYRLTFPVLADEDERVYRTYNEQDVIPLNLVIDRDFVIQYKGTGFDDTAIRLAIESNL